MVKLSTYGISDSSNMPQSNRSMKFLLALPFLGFLLVNSLFFMGLFANPFSFFPVVKTAYAFNTLWFPTGLFLIGAIAFLYTRWSRGEKSILRVSVGMIVLALFIVVIRIYATNIEPYRLTLREETLRTSKLDRSWTLLHISDIQSAAIGPYEESVFHTIHELNPDLIIHTGDLLQPRPPSTWDSEFPKIAALIDTLSPPLGIYTVIGNTDDYRPDQVMQGVGKMKILDSQDVMIPVGNHQIRILGLSLDESLNGNQERITSWLDRASTLDFTILLGHKPVYLLNVTELPIDLCLAGHTHGGQVRIPGLGPLTVLCPIPLEWGRGFHQIGNTRFNVSAGIGCEHADGIPPIRVFCPPEMTLFHIVPE